MFALLVLGTYFFPFGWMPIIIIVLTILISIFGTQQMKFELEEILIPVIILAIYLIFCYFLDMPPFVDFGYL
jgi:purine-cytosine permease-like protein